MLARLGNVLYWFFCGLIPLPLAGAAYQIHAALNPHVGSGMFDDLIPRPGTAWLSLIVLCWFLGALGVWLIGRAARYVLAGV